MDPKPSWLEDYETLRRWAGNVFLFAYETMGMLPSEPLDELKGVKIPYKDMYGNDREAMLFDQYGRLAYHDLDFYTQDMFKNQTPEAFKQYNGTRFSWQQTVKLTAYNRAVRTFGKDSYPKDWRYISIRSGHGVGKTSSTCVIALHFLICLPGSQIGMTSNSEQQVEDIFMKEIAKWRLKLKDPALQEAIVITSDHVRVEDSDDWFLRAQVARPEKPEALAGLHGPYVLIIVDEASGVADKVFEVMHGALTGDNFIVIYDSNPTRNEGEFFESHKAGSPYTKLHFSSRESPIVRPGYVEEMEEKYRHRDPGRILVRVDGEFAGTTIMDDKGWIPLFANLTILFEDEQNQIIRSPIIGVDPSGSGKDHTSIGARDNIYLKEVLYEQITKEKDLARKVETVRDVFGSSSNDIGIDAFGIGARTVAEIDTKIGEHVNAILMDKPREETKDMFHTYRSELAWSFRAWIAAGGIIVTNNRKRWIDTLDKIKYKRDAQGRIMLMDKVTFKKEYGFSPDVFDMAIITFFRENPTQKVVLTKNELEARDAKNFMAKANPQGRTSMSSM